LDERRLYEVLSLTENANDLDRTGRWFHALGRSDEQTVVEIFAQLRQSHADGRLRQFQPFRHLRYAAGSMEFFNLKTAARFSLEQRSS